MSAQKRRRSARRGADLERAAATLLKTKRTATIGSRRSEADVAPIVLPGGVVLQPECKHRTRLPALLTDALEQAERHNPGAEPIAVLRERGGRALVACDLALFAQLVGINAAALPTRHRATRRDPKQMELALG